MAVPPSVSLRYWMYNPECFLFSFRFFFQVAHSGSCVSAKGTFSLTVGNYSPSSSLPFFFSAVWSQLSERRKKYARELSSGATF